MLTKKGKITLGTKEWADSNVNCYFGCSNNCRYCYAKKMAIRFKRKEESNWNEMVPNLKNIKKNYTKRKGRIMFPTSHDITNESLSGCLIVLKKLFSSGNEVLITSKPNFKCIKEICDNFAGYKDLIQFRFTITSHSHELLDFWEPEAPSFQERFQSLRYAYHHGFKTSISIEPFLDKDPYILVEILIPFTTESIWIGKMNYIGKSGLSVTEKKFYNQISAYNSKENLITIIDKSKFYGDFIRIKDSIFNFIK